MRINFYLLVFVTTCFLTLVVKADESAKREKEVEQMIQNIIYRTLEVGDPSHEEMLLSILKNKKASHEEIENVLLKYLSGKGEPTEQYFDKNSLKSNSILYLGYIKSKNALPLLKKMILEPNDERAKYSCALAILKIEDDPVLFMKDVIKDKLVPTNRYYPLFETFMSRTGEEIEAKEPNQKLISDAKAFMKATAMDKNEDTDNVMIIDEFLSSIDKDYANSPDRREMLEERKNREKNRKVKVWNEYFSNELEKIKK